MPEAKPALARLLAWLKHPFKGLKAGLRKKARRRSSNDINDIYGSADEPSSCSDSDFEAKPCADKDLKCSGKPGLYRDIGADGEEEISLSAALNDIISYKRKGTIMPGDEAVRPNYSHLDKRRANSLTHLPSGHAVLGGAVEVSSSINSPGSSASPKTLVEAIEVNCVEPFEKEDIAVAGMISKPAPAAS